LTTQIHINGYRIKVHLKPYSVHLVSNYDLMDAMGESWRNIEMLCRKALDLHRQQFKTSLKLPLNSFIIEVLGHAYAYKILLQLRKRFDWPVFRKFSFNACNIDCGDRAHDSNRWFWDMLGFLKPVMFLRVPEH